MHFLPGQFYLLLTTDLYIRVRVRERLGATPGHVIGRGLLPGEALFPAAAAVAGN